MFDLRLYQADIIERTRDAFRRTSRVLTQSPTASGKSILIAYIAYHAALKGNRTYIVAHRDFLLDQLSAALRRMDVRHGRIQPGRPLTSWPVQLAMVQTLSRRVSGLESPDFILFDESHHVAAATYMNIIKAWPGAKVGGYTATPCRLDGRGLGVAFGELVQGPGTRELIDDKWLCDFTYLAPPPRVDLSGLKTRGSDYDLDAQAEALNKTVITGDCIEHYKAYLSGRPTIVFCTRIQHAVDVAKAAADAGIAATYVDGTLDRHVIDARIRGLGNGNTELLTSCDLIGEGLDIPAVAGAIILRKTKSLANFLQWVGRTLRPKDDGSGSIILDHVDCITNHGRPDAPRDWTLDDKVKRPPAPGVQTCKKCFRVFHATADWADGVSCSHLGDARCILTPEPQQEDTGIAWVPPEQVAGQLQQFTSRPDWAGGIDILRAAGPEYKAMLARAATYAQVDEIRRARGYSPYWTRQIMKSRRVARFGS